MTDPTAQARAGALLIAILDEPGSNVLKVNPQKWDKQIALLIAALQAAYEIGGFIEQCRAQAQPAQGKAKDETV